LRAAIRAESTLEYERASTFFQQAYDLCLDLYRTNNNNNKNSNDRGLINLSGIAVRWGGMWESTGRLDKAIQVYDTGFQPIADLLARGSGGGGGGGGSTIQVEEVKRGAGLALKLGDLWVTLGNSEPSLNGEAQQEAERYYSWAVGELMRLSLTPEQRAKVKTEMDKQENPGRATTPPSMLAEEEKEKEKEKETGIELPEWIGEVELVAAFERLGDLYSRQGRIE
jgi:tetratricopeptide (TPR) repeat protein